MVVTESFIKSWFALQQQLIAGLQLAYVDLHGSGVRSGALVVTFPDDLQQTDEMALAAKLAQRSRAPVTSAGSFGAEGGEGVRIACPLHLGQHTDGAVVVEVAGPLERQAAVLQALKWGEAWLQLALAQQHGESRGGASRDLMDEILRQPDYAATLTAVLALLPGHVGCTRVGLGRADAGEVRLEAVSGVNELDRRGARAQALQAALAEAIAVQQTLRWPIGNDDEGPAAENGDRQSALVAQAGLNGVCTVPLRDGLRVPLAFCFEFAADDVPDAGTTARCEEAVRIVAPLLELRRELARPWWRRLFALGREGLAGLTARHARLRAVLVAAALLALVAFLFSPADYRVSAPATLEGAVQQAVVAPFDGYIVDSGVRAGQQVGRGDILARLDERELLAERRRLRAEQAEYVEQHRQAVATLAHGQAKVLDAQLEQTRARLALVEERLARTELRAPLDGLVISGDWTRSLGVPVTRGDLMFQIAPLDDYRVALQVSDRDIAGFSVGQQGRLTLSALPRDSIGFRVTTISSIAPDEVAEPGFRVQGALNERPPGLRPGMQGIAKVTLGERRRWWIWTHRLTDWIRLQLWRLLP
jgi:multidrug efflux pump subunit AcrA (membrane-fusion protein)